MTDDPITEPSGTPPDPDAAGLIPAAAELPADPSIIDALAGAQLPADVLEHATKEAGQ